jgi:excisionase family DNA binding protein
MTARTTAPARPTHLPASKLLTTADVAALLQVSAQTIRKWVSQGTFPKPVRMGRKVRWDAETVRRALAARGLRVDVAGAALGRPGS